MSGVVAVGPEPAAAWTQIPLALAVVPVDADRPAEVPVGVPHPVVAVRADPGSIVAAVCTAVPDEVLVDAGPLGDLAAPVLVALREAGVACGVRADGAPASLATMLEPDADARGVRRVVAPARVAGLGAIPAPLSEIDASELDRARLRSEVDALALRNAALEGALRGLAGVAATARVVVRTTSPRAGRTVMRVYRRGRDAAMAVGLWQPRS